jgi:hypothetical protein
MCLEVIRNVRWSKKLYEKSYAKWRRLVLYINKTFQKNHLPSSSMPLQSESAQKWTVFSYMNFIQIQQIHIK